MTDDLLEFLRARLPDDERAARGATHGGTPWRIDGTSIVGRSWRASERSPETLVVKHTWPQEARHIVRWDPRRVLALIGALRAIVDGFSYEGQETRAVMLLAQALYGEDPEFRDEWRIA